MNYPVYFSKVGVPQAGLTPVWISLQNALTTVSVLPGPTIMEIGGGWYTFSYTPSSPLVGVIDGGTSLSGADRYKSFSIPVGPATSAGSVSVIFQTTDPVQAVPIPDVEFIVLNQNETLLVNSGATNSMGQISVQLNPGQYVVRVRKDGYNFTTPVTITVSVSATFTFNGTQVGDIAADFRAIVVPRNLSQPEDG
jgi:hypothetical protein